MCTQDLIPIETFGSPLSEVASNQLKNRSRINLTGLSYFEDGNLNLGNGTRGTDDFLKKQLFNTSWINLISSVNNMDDQAQETDKDSNLARRLVLSGGTLKWDGEKFVKSEGIDLSSTATGTYGQQFAYNRNSQTGVRPMPGITGFQIVSKNLNGTIREATIQFNVWSLPELEDIEKLYLRPGYHVITEWGHTYGLDEDGNPSSFPVSTLSNYDKFFNETPADSVYKIIEDTIGNNYGNYDAFLGIVKNFSWSFRQDGGYDCSISVISKGEVLDSLSVRSGLTGPSSEDEEQSENDFLNSNLLTRFIKIINSAEVKMIGSTQVATSSSAEARLASQIAIITLSTLRDSSKTQALPSARKILALLEQYLTQKNIREAGDLTNIKRNTNTETTFDQPLGVRKTLYSEPSIWNFGGLFSSSKEIYYVPLNLIIFFINKFIQESSTSNKFPNINESSCQEYFTFDGYVNLAPHVSIATPLKYDTLLHPFLRDGFQANNLITNLLVSNRITDILVSTQIVGQLLMDFIHSSEDPENFDIITFFKNLLKQIETSLGGINEFDLDYSEDSNVFTVIDRKLPAPSVESKVPPIINVYGAGSVALDISIQTKITNKLGNQIAVAAQGPDGEAQINSSMPEFKKWNKNLIDRFDIKDPDNSNTEQNFRDLFTFDPSRDPNKPLRVPKPVPKTNEELQDESIRKKAEAFSDKVKKLYDIWHLKNRAKLDGDQGWDSLLVQGQTLYTMIASDFNNSIGLPPQGIIPTVLSLTVDGVGGIKIGQSFQLSKGVLPKRYEDFGYIVTGINHSIENNKWTTKIDAQTYYVGIPDQNDKNKAIERLNRILPFSRTSGQNATNPIKAKRKNDDTTQYSPVPGQQSQQFRGIPPGTAILDEDPAPIINSGRVGSNYYTSSNLAKTLASAGGQNGLLDIKNSKFLVFIGETQGASNLYTNPATKKAEYALAPAAAQAWFKWRDEMKAEGVPYSISSAYRSVQHQKNLGSSNTVASPGSSPHGWGGALDFGNLYRIVGGNGQARPNLTGRKTDVYERIARIGAKYGWYNPWRLSNNQGLNEIWHFEYWG